MALLFLLEIHEWVRHKLYPCHLKVMSRNFIKKNHVCPFYALLVAG